MKATYHLVKTLGQFNMPPMWCVGCPFGTAKEPINQSDPSEGNYQCELLNKVVWGEDPECRMLHWSSKAKEELGIE